MYKIICFPVLIFLLSYGGSIKAQGCIDPYNVSTTYVCPAPDFYPVCGCDKKTYRNACEATYRNGITSYYDGSCSGFEIDIYPTIAQNTLNFTLVQVTNPAFVKMVIIDAFGKIVHTENVTVTNRFYSSIDISGFLQGVYFMFVYDNKENYRYKKFIRYNN